MYRRHGTSMPSVTLLCQAVDTRWGRRFLTCGPRARRRNGKGGRRVLLRRAGTSALAGGMRGTSGTLRGGRVSGSVAKALRAGPGGVVQAGAGPAARPATALPARSEGVVCPNLPQRPRSSRSAGGESLIFRAFLRGRYRRGAPLWQIWTRSRPGSSQEPHPPHVDTPRITFPDFCNRCGQTTPPRAPGGAPRVGRRAR